MLYNDGLAAIIAFGGVYASATFGWSTMTLGIFGIILTVFAIPGAFLGGKLDDLHRQQAHRADRHRRRDRRHASASSASPPTACCSSIPADPISPTRGLFGSAQEKVFMAFALLLGFCMGPMQAASRTLIGRLAPEGMTGEFYGLFALSGRATAWMAPLAIGIITRTTQSTRLGVACVLFFLVLGFCCCGGCARSRRRPTIESRRATDATAWSRNAGRAFP